MASMEEELRKKFQSEYEEYKSATVHLALIGQPGAGKSSLINTLVGADLFKAGAYTDTTTQKQEIIYGPLVITDLPGYGTDKFPLKKWLEEFQPEQYDLYLFVFSGKLHDSDEKLFFHFKQWKHERKHPYFLVRTKADDLWDPSKTVDELKNDITNDIIKKFNDSTTKVYFVSSRTGIGIDELKQAILASPINETLKSKIITSFKARTKADLKQKREAVNEIIHKSALYSATSALIPLPGTDIAVDYKIIEYMLDDIKAAFGLSNIKNVKDYEKYGPIATNIANKIIKYLGQEGIKGCLLYLLKKYGTKALIKQGAKYIPLIGQIVSASISALLIELLGKEFADDCLKLAEIILENTIKDTIE